MSDLYICRRCGEILNEGLLETEYWEEYLGDCFGFPAYESCGESSCPYCGGRVEEYEEYDEDDEECEEDGEDA